MLVTTAASSVCASRIRTRRAQPRKPWKLLSTSPEENKEPSLYDLEADPEELANLASRYPTVVAELEDRISALDQELQVIQLGPAPSADRELLQLWRHRVGLMDALVNVHLTRASNVGL